MTAKSKSRMVKRCPYCGRVVSAGIYCRMCVRDGFDNVHTMFGKTNGWDRYFKKRIVPEDGWKGQGLVSG